MAGPELPGFDEAIHPDDRQYVVATNTGMRSWYITDWEKPLRSMTWAYYWHGRGPHSSFGATYSPIDTWEESYPKVGNSVGFYAYYINERYYGWCDGSARFRIGGTVEGYGRTVVGTKGFRAERAVILGFAMDTLTRISQTFYSWQLEITPEMVADVRAYLEKMYPTVPIFNTTAELLSVTPLSSKPNFTQYDDGK